MKSTIEAPSKELQQIEIIPIDIHNQKKWAELFLKIPCCRTVITSLRQFDEGGENYTGRVIYDDVVLDSIFLIEVAFQPGVQDDPDAIDCHFYMEKGLYRARIEKLSEIPPTEERRYRNRYPQVIEKGFFGFEGAWEEVIRKIIEINNLLTTVPAF